MNTQNTEQQKRLNEIIREGLFSSPARYDLIYRVEFRETNYLRRTDLVKCLTRNNIPFEVVDAELLMALYGNPRKLSTVDTNSVLSKILFSNFPISIPRLL